MGCGWAGGDAFSDIVSYAHVFCMTTRTGGAAMNKK
jgi:hypothetical protein